MSKNILNPKDIKVNLITMGCDKNKIDSEIMLTSLAKNGFKLTEDETETDIFIINSCGFLESSIRESLDVFFQAAQMKKEDFAKSRNEPRRIILTGCLPSRYKNNRTLLREKIPEADMILSMDNPAELGKLLLEKIYPPGRSHRSHRFPSTGKINKIAARKIWNLSGATCINEGYAFVKIAEGCNHQCTFCTIPQIRGKQKSVPLNKLIRIAEKKSSQGIKEFNLVAQDTLRYGSDLAENQNLLSLSKALVKLPKLKWLRYLYLYPDFLSNELIDFIINESKCVNYFDIPFQHISDKILASMGRPGSENKYRDLVKKIRSAASDVAIRTSFILGFPGETKKDFQILIDFVEEIKIEKIGIFLYSNEKGTRAYHLKDKIPQKTAEERRDILMEVQKVISKKKLKKMVGKKIEALIEKGTNEEYQGRTRWDAPEVDGQIFIYSKKKLKPGEIVPVEVTGSLDYDLLAEVY